MKIIDISMPVSKEMPVYKNREDKKPVISVTKDFSAGNIFESRISMDLHTGTHIDAPLHIIEGGNSIEKYDLSKFITECTVLDLTHVCDKITVEDLRIHSSKIRPDTFILLKTKNSFSEIFDPDYVYLAADAAEYLKGFGISGVGIDSLGIERAQPRHETHKILLSAGIAILEGLRLAEASEGTYSLIALPVNIPGAEAAPARAALIA